LADYGAEDDANALDKMTDTVKQVTGTGPNLKLAKAHFDKGQTVYANAVRIRGTDDTAANDLFLNAAEEFDKASSRWPDSAVEEESLFLKGECEFFTDHYEDAEDTFARLLKKYPRSRYLDLTQARRFAIAQYWFKTNQSDPMALYEVNIFDESLPARDLYGHSMRVFNRIRLDDPTGKLADDATLALANAQLEAERFLKADEYYTDLRKTFPSSEHQFLAHFLGLKAKLMSYQGADYSGNALVEAEKLLKQIQRQFPVEAQQEREYLARAGAEIRFRLAEREWHRAQRHLRRSEYGAAKVYLSTLLTEYDDTPFAQRAADKMQDIGGRPDIPPQRLGWLVDLFPERDNVTPLMATQGSTPTRR
jgi:outer membrane protein assembly factor BamD (BamD/ComL family)